MKWIVILLIGCGKPDGGSIGVQGTDTGESEDELGLIAVTGGLYRLGETDLDRYAHYLGGPGEYRTIIPAQDFELTDFWIDRYPFPGVVDAEWFTDGATHDTITALHAGLSDFGRRPCTIAELLYAAAGPNNNRYPYGNEYDASACEPDDENPQPIGTFSRCKSVHGVQDFQVRATWGILDEQTLNALNSGGDQQPISADLDYAIWGGTSRTDTIQAPTNFGFHQHGDDPTRYLDDGFRVCADQQPTTNQNLAYNRWRQRAIDAGSYQGFLTE